MGGPDLPTCPWRFLEVSWSKSRCHCSEHDKCSAGHLGWQGSRARGSSHARASGPPQLCRCPRRPELPGLALPLCPGLLRTLGKVQVPLDQGGHPLAPLGTADAPGVGAN